MRGRSGEGDGRINGLIEDRPCVLKMYSQHGLLAGARDAYRADTKVCRGASGDAQEHDTANGTVDIERGLARFDGLSLRVGGIDRALILPRFHRGGQVQGYVDEKNVIRGDRHSGLCNTQPAANSPL